MPKMNLIGQRFGKLTVTEYAESIRNNQTTFKCLCDCGNEHIALGYLLKRNAVQSCGCLRIETSKANGLSSKKHGMYTTKIYYLWRGMRQRCENPNAHGYPWYGAKGVKVCERWQSFDNFFADMGDKPEGLSLDRINPFGDYEPSNCRWADATTQRLNTRDRYL